MSAILETLKPRALAPRDLDAVIGIDAALSGRSRRAYFERRLRAQPPDPARYVQLGIEHDGALAGFMTGRALEGEFGLSAPELRLDAFGVKPTAHGLGLGSALSAALEAAARKRGIAEIRTSALWRQHELLRFLDRAGYRLSTQHVLDCAPSREFEPLARDEVSIELLRERDLEGIARIDRRHTGRDRRAYLRRSFEETLADSAVRVSLTARVDGGVAGFVMARLDYGDYGRAEPVAAIDTLGVDPLRARQGIGRALLSQLFINLAALGVERVETLVEPASLDLMGFFHAAGLRPSERLSFVKRL
ncbi:MAG TPA: GNAT family N-acetyltransferase [Ideonella sp.]|nr:GNAT family N-acetyltransferase [Ideonella sp.]